GRFQNIVRVQNMATTKKTKKVGTANASLFEIPIQVLKNAPRAKERIQNMSVKHPTELTLPEARYLTMLIDFALTKDTNDSAALFTYHEFQTYCQRHNALAKTAKDKVPTH